MANKAGPQVLIGNGCTINADAAPYFRDLIADVKAETGVLVHIISGTRDWNEQYRLWKGYVDRKKGFNPAWHPDDVRAFHVAGYAIDFGSGAGTRGTPVQASLHRNGPRFGVIFDISNELWHGRFVPTLAPRRPTAPASSGKAPTPITPAPIGTKGPDMYLLHSPTRSFLVGSKGATSLNSESFQFHLNAKDAAGLPVFPILNTNERGVDLALAAARDMK